MKKYIGIIAMVMIGAVVQSKAVLLTNFVYNSHTYHIYSDTETWANAQSAAEGLNVGGVSGNLARIDSSEENDAIFGALQALDSNFTATAGDGGSARYAWIGANDISTEDSWVWSDDDAVFGTAGETTIITNFGFGDMPMTIKTWTAENDAYENWGRGAGGGLSEPDDSNDNQDAAGIGLDDWPSPDGGLGTAGQWNDIAASNSMPYIVEFAAVPEPAVVSLIALTGVGLVFFRRFFRRG